MTKINENHFTHKYKIIIMRLCVSYLVSNERALRVHSRNVISYNVSNFFVVGF